MTALFLKGDKVLLAKGGVGKVAFHDPKGGRSGVRTSEGLKIVATADLRRGPAILPPLLRRTKTP